MSGHATTPPANLKPVLPYLLRANEMRKQDPVISYYCRMWAMRRGLSLKKSKDDEAFLGKLMGELEKDHGHIKHLGNTEAKEYVENFALKIFDKADTEDREGKSTAATAKTFHAAAVFMETLEQFGELSDDIKEKIKFAKWKAVDITKAIKAGKVVEPVVPNQDEDDREPPPVSPAKVSKNTVDKAPESAHNYVPPETGASPSDMALAQKYARHAISALEFEDVPAAIKLLGDAIKVLEAASKGKKKW